MVRIRSILAKYKEQGVEIGQGDLIASAEACGAGKSVLLDVAGFSKMVEEAFAERAPHKVCAFVYKLANDFNSFYHEVKILAEEDEDKKKSYVSMLAGVLSVFETCIGLLGFESPERM